MISAKDIALDTVESATAPTPPSRAKQVARIAGWTAAFVALLVAFTVAKLPDDRIGSLILDQASTALSSGGRRISFTAERTRISLLLLGRIRFEGLTMQVESHEGSPISVRWEEVRLSPSFLDLFLARLGGTVRLTGKNDARMSASFWANRSGKFSLSSRLENGDLGANGLGLLPMLAGISGTLPLTGQIELSGETSRPNTLAGAVQLELGRSEIPSQKISGFPIPAIRLNDGEIKLAVSGGKATIQALRLGKMDREADDLRATVTGNITLGEHWNNSLLNLSARLKLSDSLLKGLFILDAFLGPGKQADGSYSIRISGSLFAPQVVPGGGTP